MLNSADQLCRLWLSLCEGVSLKAREKLLHLYGSYEAVFEQFPRGTSGILSAKTIQELSRLKAIGVDKLLLRLEELHINVSFVGDENYPILLSNIQDAPDTLFYKGILFREEVPSVAIVGSRRETRYGRNQAFNIAQELARQGVCIVSGLARGIDTAAHQGALAAGGRTIAVLGSGLNRMYPAENLKLAEEIISAGGAVITELPPNTEPLAYHFPIRNRIVSGLAHATVLVEAREKSGTLITLNHALEQGREVFALPGEVDSPGSVIPNRMIREGARLCTCAGDILEDMGWIAYPCKEEQLGFPSMKLNAEQTLIYEALQDDSKSFEELIAITKLDTAQLNTQITFLELDGIIEILPGRMFKLGKA